MMKKFDPAEQRRVLLDEIVGIPRSLRQDLEEQRRGGGLWGGARTFIGQAVRCYLLEIERHPEVLLAKAMEWLKVAIAIRQPTGGFPEEFLLAEYHVCAAVASWLNDGQHEAEHLRLAVASTDALFVRVPTEMKASPSLGAYAPRFIDAGADADWLRWTQANGKVALPERCTQARGPAVVATVIAAHRTTGRYQPAEITRMLDSFLAKNFDDWVTRGRVVYAAHWLKIRHAGDGRPPRQIVFEANRYLSR